MSREVALQFVSRRQASVAELEKQLKHEGRDDFANAYRAALADVLTIVSETINEQPSTETLRETVAGKRHWAAILATLASGSRTPSEVANQLKLSLPTVSRCFAELRDSGLVEESPAGPGADQRARPQRLTEKGKTATPSGTLSDEVASSIRSTAKLFRTLLIEGSIWEHDLAHAFPSYSWRESALDVLRSELKGPHLALDIGGTFAFAPQMEARVGVMLASLLRGSSGFPNFLETICSQIQPNKTALVVRSASAAVLWDQCLELVRDRYELAEVRTLTRADVRANDAPRLRNEHIVLVYEDIRMLLADQRDWPEFHELEKSSQRRFCLTEVAHEQFLPDSWEPIRVDQ